MFVNEIPMREKSESCLFVSLNVYISVAYWCCNVADPPVLYKRRFLFV